jgi:uncharacterized membrane protein YadS
VVTLNPRFGATYLSGVTALSPLIIAITFGMFFHNMLGTPAVFKSGVTFDCGARTQPRRW